MAPWAEKRKKEMNRKKYVVATDIDADIFKHHLTLFKHKFFSRKLNSCTVLLVLQRQKRKQRGGVTERGKYYQREETQSIQVKH